MLRDVLTLVLLLCLCQSNTEELPGTAVEIRAQALTKVLQQSVMAKAKTLYVHVQASSSTARDQLNELLTRLLVQLPALPRYLSFQRKLEYKPFTHAVLLLVDDLQSLRRIYAAEEATSNLSHTLIYVAQPTDAYHEHVQQALQLLWQLSVLNVGLILQTRSESLGQLIMVSYYPFSATHGCQVIRASVVNRYDVALERWASEDYFPKKLRNFFGCQLTCATWEDMPYLVLQSDGSFVGIEGSLLEFMAGNLNFSVGLYWMNKTQVQATFNETGWIFEEIFATAADYALGGFHYKPRSTQREVASAPYSQSTYYFMSHIMMVTNLQNAFSPYEKLAFPFHPQLWLAVGLVLTLGCLIIWLLRRPRFRTTWRFVMGSNNRTPYFNIFVLAFGADIPNRQLPRRNFARFLICVWMLATLVIRSAYQSGMYQLLRDNMQRNPPQTIAAVLSQRYTIQLIPENERFLSSLPELRSKQVSYLAGSELQSFPALAASSGTSKLLAIITPYEYFGYFRKAHPKSRQLHVVRERIFTQQLSFYVRRNSYLVGVLNEQISHAHGLGFLMHWTSKYVSPVDEPVESVTRITPISYEAVFGTDEQQLSKETELMDKQTPVKLNVLSMKELEALFWLVLWAHLCAVVAFGVELLLVRQSSMGAKYHRSSYKWSNHTFQR